MDEDIKKRFEESEGAIKEYARQLKALKDDLEVVIKFVSPDIVVLAHQQATTGRTMSNWVNAPEADAVFHEKCRRFVERYEKPI